jgi:hypothetical protein
MQKKGYENSSISPCKKLYLIFKKNPLPKWNQNPSRYHNSITKSQVSTQAKISSFKNPHIKIDYYYYYYYLGAYENPLSYYTL